MTQSDMATRPDPAVRKFTGWHMVAVIGGFFGIIIAVNVTLAVFATRSWTGLVVKNTYVASQHFNEALAAARVQAALGWSDELRFAAGRLDLRMTDRDGSPLYGLAVTAEIGRPIHDGENRLLPLTEVSGGLYRGELTLRPGQWRVEIGAVDAAGRRFRKIHRLFVKD